MGNLLLLVIVLAPLFASVLIPLLKRKSKAVPLILSAISVGMSFFASIALAYVIYFHGRISYNLGGWGLPWGIELAGDYLNIVFAVTVAGVGFLTIIYSWEYINRLLSVEKQRTFYYSLLCLMLGSIQAFLLAGDLFTMFIYISVFSLAGVALIAIGGEDQAVWAAVRYLILSTVGGVFLLLGIALLYYFTGTLNMVELSHRLSGVAGTKSVLTAVVLLIVGFSVKAALFPLHVWMPDAHAFAPSPVSAVLSGLVIEMGAYGILRSMLFLFQLKISAITVSVSHILCWMAGAAIIYGAVAAIFQKDLKLIFAYSSVSQIGYIVLGISLGSYLGLLGGLLHIVNHAVLKSTLFLCAGALFYKTGRRDLDQLRGMGKKMPFTCGALAIAALAMIGMPPFCGFVSEWYICLGAIDSGHIGFAVVMLAGSLLSVVYYMKVINSLYFKFPRDLNAAEIVVDEAPLSMLAPIWLLALAAIGLGLFNRLPLLWLKRAVASILIVSG